MAIPPPAGAPGSRRGREPTASSAEREAFTALVEASLPAVRASAQAWRTGLITLITLITTGIVIKGPATTAGLSTGRRVVVTITIGGGLFIAVLGLWQVLAAEAGSRTQLQTLADIHARYTTVLAYQVALANKTGRRLRWARYAVGIAITLLLSGIILTWWAPTAAPPPGYLKVTHENRTTCGTPATTGMDQLLLTSPNTHDSTWIPFTAITGITLTSTCS
jgi:hypothetical protein